MIAMVPQPADPIATAAAVDNGGGRPSLCGWVEIQDPTSGIRQGMMSALIGPNLIYARPNV